MFAKYSSNSSCQIDSKSLQESIPYIGVIFKMITYTGDRGFGTQYGYTYMLLFSVILKLICRNRADPSRFWYTVGKFTVFGVGQLKWLLITNSFRTLAGQTTPFLLR